jgi:hypothetical protein
MPKSVAVNNGIPISGFWKLINHAYEQQIVPLALVVSVIAIEIQAHSGSRLNFFRFQVRHSGLGERMLPARPGTRIEIDPSRWSIARRHLLAQPISKSGQYQKPETLPCRSYSSARSIFAVTISPTFSGRRLER